MGWGKEKGGQEGGRGERVSEYVHGLYVHIIKKNIKHLSE